jgi:hypothetical protein
MSWTTGKYSSLALGSMLDSGPNTVFIGSVAVMAVVLYGLWLVRGKGACDPVIFQDRPVPF